jgi:hypothetical protein
VLVGEEERAEHYQIDQLVDHITQFSLAAMGLASPLAPSQLQRESVTIESTRDR